MIENVTLETLPKAFMELYQEVIEMKRLMQEQAKPQQTVPGQLMIVEDAARFLSLSRHTIYGLVNRNAIPYMKKGKRLYFTTEQLTTWLKSGRSDRTK